MVAFKNTELQMTKWLELFLTTVRIDLHSPRLQAWSKSPKDLGFHRAKHDFIDYF